MSIKKNGSACRAEVTNQQERDQLLVATNPVRFVGGTAWLRLHNGNGVETCIDAEDWAEVKKYPWYIYRSKSGGTDGTLAVTLVKRPHGKDRLLDLGALVLNKTAMEQMQGEIQTRGSDSTPLHIEGDSEELILPESKIRVFDFIEDWHLVRPHLHRPQVEKALERGMNAYRAMRARLCTGPSCWKEPYDTAAGPLSCDSSNGWFLERNRLLDEAI